MPGHVSALKDKTGKPLKRADGTTVWRARYPDPTKGGTAQIEKRFRSQREAVGWLKRQGVAVMDGTHVDPRKGERLLSEVADAWRETWTDLEPRTRAGYDAILRKHIIGTDTAPARFHRAKVGAMSPEVVQRWVNDLAETRAPNTVRRIYTVLRGVLRVAVERGYLAANPCDAVRLPTKRAGKSGSRPKRMLFLEPHEVRALADAMPEPYGAAVLLSAWCGLRAGELWALRRRDLDPLHGTLRIERALKEINSSSDEITSGLILGPPKTEESNRTLKVPAPVLAVLLVHVSRPAPAAPDGGVVVVRDTDDGPAFERSDDRMDPDALLFSTARGLPVRHNNFYKKVFKPTVVGRPDTPARRVRTGNGTRLVPARPAVPAALPDRLHKLRWHDLRHTCASLALAVAPNLAVVKELLGHEDIRTTVNIYGHLVPSVRDALADGMAALFEAPAPAAVERIAR